MKKHSLERTISDLRNNMSSQIEKVYKYVLSIHPKIININHRGKASDYVVVKCLFLADK